MTKNTKKLAAAHEELRKTMKPAVQWAPVITMLQATAKSLRDAKLHRSADRCINLAETVTKLGEMSLKEQEHVAKLAERIAAKAKRAEALAARKAAKVKKLQDKLAAVRAALEAANKRVITRTM